MKRSTIFIILGISAAVIAAALVYFMHQHKKKKALEAAATPTPALPDLFAAADNVRTIPIVNPGAGTNTGGGGVFVPGNNAPNIAVPIVSNI